MIYQSHVFSTLVHMELQWCGYSKCGCVTTTLGHFLLNGLMESKHSYVNTPMNRDTRLYQSWYINSSFLRSKVYPNSSRMGHYTIFVCFTSYDARTNSDTYDLYSLETRYVIWNMWCVMARNSSCIESINEGRGVTRVEWCVSLAHTTHPNVIVFVARFGHRNCSLWASLN